MVSNSFKYTDKNRCIVGNEQTAINVRHQKYMYVRMSGDNDSCHTKYLFAALSLINPQCGFMHMLNN